MKRALLAAGLALILQLGLARTAAAHPGTGIAVDRQGRVHFTDLNGSGGGSRAGA
jgi:hypothetical protein